MDIGGPSFVPVRAGRPFNKYEVFVRERTPKGCRTTLYWFDKKDDAELYFLFLQQEFGVKELDATISSNRTYRWEKEELSDFRDTLDLETLPQKVKNIKFTTETVFVEMRYGQK